MHSSSNQDNLTATKPRPLRLILINVSQKGLIPKNPIDFQPNNLHVYKLRERVRQPRQHKKDHEETLKNGK